jgi:hypothetical protein
LGPADRQLGLLHQVRGDQATAIELLESAVEVSTFIGSVLWRARSLCDLGYVTADRSALAEALNVATAYELPAVRRLAGERLARL